MTPEKWESIQDLDIFPSLDFIILTEHQLSAQFRPDEIIRSGWDFHAVSGVVTNLPRKGYRGQRHRGRFALLTRNSKHFSVKMKSLSGVVNKITGHNCKCMDKRRDRQGHGSGFLQILHQAVTWSLTPPLYNDTIHLTGVYIFPDENQLQEFFDTLIAHSNHPPHEPQIYAGDFNAYTAEELENHVTPQELRTLLRRSGDINPAHSPAPPLTSAAVPAADYRGRLLLNMINSLKFIITNGRFPVPPLTLRPYTFLRKSNTHSVLDYNLIAKHHVPLIQKCEVLRDSLPACVTDHMPIHLHLDLPTLPTPTLKPSSQSSPPRTLYHSKRLKDKDTKEAFTRALAKTVSRITPSIQKLHAQLLGKNISPQSFEDTANSEITSVLQKTALEILTHIDPSPHTRTTANPHVKPSNNHSSRDPHEALLQRTIQLHRNALVTRGARRRRALARRRRVPTGSDQRHEDGANSYPSLYLNSPPRSRTCDSFQTSPLALLESLI